MKIISENQIKDLGITPATCVDWAKESFSIKNKAQLPAKISVHPQGNDFFTSMPCLLPQEFSRFGIKVVHRIVGGIPALGSDILLYDSNTGELLALLGGDWITAMRTGAVATLAIQTLKATDATTYSFIGLGNTARATMLCLLDSQKNPQSIQSQQLPCCLSFSSKQEAATALAYRATTGCVPSRPTRNPPNRCFHRLLSLKKSITLPITILSLILKKFDRLRRYLNSF